MTGCLDADPDTNGRPSDHRIVILKPISVLNNESGMIMMRKWMKNNDWCEIYQIESIHEKASIL